VDEIGGGVVILGEGLTVQVYRACDPATCTTAAGDKFREDISRKVIKIIGCRATGALPDAETVGVVEL
jgi:hypothetical protein